jgi:hypothetical protein
MTAMKLPALSILFDVEWDRACERVHVACVRVHVRVCACVHVHVGGWVSGWVSGWVGGWWISRWYGWRSASKHCRRERQNDGHDLSRRSVKQRRQEVPHARAAPRQREVDGVLHRQ